MKNTGIIYLHRTPRLSKKQFDRVSNILDNIGQVVLASGVIEPIFTGLDLQSIIVVLLSLSLSFSLWGLSLLFARLSE